MPAAVMEKKQTETAIAAELGITYHTLRSYRRRGCTAETAGEVAAWRDENIGYGRPTLGERKNGSFKDGQDLDEQEQRAKIAAKEEEARHRRIQNDILEAKLYDADDVEQSVAELTSLIRHRIETIPDELQTELPPEIRLAITERLRDKIYLILTEMSQWKLTTEE